MDERVVGGRNYHMADSHKFFLGPTSPFRESPQKEAAIGRFLCEQRCSDGPTLELKVSNTPILMGRASPLRNPPNFPGSGVIARPGNRRNNV